MDPPLAGAYPPLKYYEFAEFLVKSVCSAGRTETSAPTECASVLRKRKFLTLANDETFRFREWKNKTDGMTKHGCGFGKLYKKTEKL